LYRTLTFMILRASSVVATLQPNSLADIDYRSSKKLPKPWIEVLPDSQERRKGLTPSLHYSRKWNAEQFF
jgi:hypothetical protein